ncbi:MAG TPA: hypothetical protein VE177_02070 [Candidatus Binatus sp.]|nr:hypothetical protein [Candidatus Binatus sp.]
MKNMKTAKKHFRRILKDKRGIDTILAALLMVVIVVVASVMVYAWSTGLLGALMVTPQVGKESMVLENSAFSNSTSATLYVRNTGSASATLVTYYVKDSTNAQYSRTGWTGPSNQAPNALMTIYVNIGASCGSCTPASNNFVYTTGNSYTVIVVTSRNNQFTFTVTK